MFNDELNEKKVQDLVQNTTVSIELTVEQVSDIFASLQVCAGKFQRVGLSSKAEQLKTLAGYLVAKSALSISDK